MTTFSTASLPRNTHHWTLKQELSSMSDTELNNFREALLAELGLEMTQEDVSDDHPKQLKEELRSKARRGTTPTSFTKRRETDEQEGGTLEYVKR
jgi:hypothetical protein